MAVAEDLPFDRGQGRVRTGWIDRPEPGSVGNCDPGIVAHHLGRGPRGSSIVLRHAAAVRGPTIHPPIRPGAEEKPVRELAWRYKASGETRGSGGCGSGRRSGEESGGERPVCSRGQTHPEVAVAGSAIRKAKIASIRSGTKDWKRI